MCFPWEDKIHRCENCSETDFRTVVRICWEMEPTRPTHQLVAHMARNSLAQGHPQSSSQNAQTDHERNRSVERQKESCNNSRAEKTDALEADMTLSLPRSWEDEGVISTLVQEQLRCEEFLERQKQRLEDIWGPYGEEREALAALQTPEPGEVWTPDCPEDEMLEREIPLGEDFWESSVQAGEAWMRSILDEDETWPRESPEEYDDIWTREPEGILGAANLRRLSNILKIQASLEEEGAKEKG